MPRQRAKAGGEVIHGRFFKGGQFIPAEFIIDPPFDELAQSFRGVNKRIAKPLEKLVEKIFNRLQKNTPRRTGKLVQSQSYSRMGDLVWHIYESVDPPYGKFISTGVPAAKINPILPRKEKALWWPGLPHPVRAVYNHPGIKANPYVPKTVDDSMKDIEQTANKIGDDVIVSILDVR